MGIRISVLFIKVYILTTIYFIAIFCTTRNRDYEYSHSLKLSKVSFLAYIYTVQIPNDSYILVHTLGGEILCVHRRSGHVKWKFDSGMLFLNYLHSVVLASALSASYDNG